MTKKRRGPTPGVHLTKIIRSVRLKEMSVKRVDCNRAAQAETFSLTHRRTGRGGEGGCSPPKFWATQIFWAAREILGKGSFLRCFRVF